jgi:hypothetical protein
MTDAPQFVEGLVIHPGDILLVRVPMGISIDVAKALKAQCEEHLPDIKAVIIAAEQLVVVRG